MGKMCWFNLFFVLISVSINFGVNSEKNVASILETLQLRMSAIEHRNMALQNEVKTLKEENQVLMSVVQESTSISGEGKTRSIKFDNYYLINSC